MNEKNKIAEFTQGFDLILKGDFGSFNIEDTENQRLLKFVDQIGKVDYSGDSKISEILKKQLFRKMKEQSYNGELSDAELDYAAGGLDDFREEDDPEK